MSAGLLHGGGCGCADHFRSRLFVSCTLASLSHCVVLFRWLAFQHSSEPKDQCSPSCRACTARFLLRAPCAATPGRTQFVAPDPACGGRGPHNAQKQFARGTHPHKQTTSFYRNINSKREATSLAPSSRSRSFFAFLFWVVFFPLLFL